MLVSEGFSLFYQYADSISLLMLSAVGLMIIFGMMGVINMAHGELMFIGAYTTSVVFYAGAPLFVAIPAGALAAGAFGVVLERLIIRRFYGQLLSSLVVTWGLSLLLGQGFLLVIGPSIRSLPTPFGSFSVGGFTYSYYRLFMFVLRCPGRWRLGIVEIHEIRRRGSRYHGKSPNGACTRRQCGQDLHADIRPWRGTGRHSRKLIRIAVADRADIRAQLHPDSVYHSGRRGKLRHCERSDRKRPVLVRDPHDFHQPVQHPDRACFDVRVGVRFHPICSQRVVRTSSKQFAPAADGVRGLLGMRDWSPCVPCV